MGRKNLRKYYITSDQIAENWNELRDSKECQETGEKISRTFKRILDKLVENEENSGKRETSVIRSIYKTVSESDLNVNKWIFFNSSEIAKVNKEIASIDVLEEGALSRYWELTKEGLAFDSKFKIYEEDACGTMKRLFELGADIFSR